MVRWRGLKGKTMPLFSLHIGAPPSMSWALLMADKLNCFREPLLLPRDLHSKPSLSKQMHVHKCNFRKDTMKSAGSKFMLEDALELKA